MARAADASAPCRADLAGGTLDIWPLGLLHDDALTVNVAVPVRVRLEVVEVDTPGVRHVVVGSRSRELDLEDPADLTSRVVRALRPRGGLDVRVYEQAPVGSGLGGSSAYAVALARALCALEGREIADDDLVSLLRDLEAQVLATPTGCQDHWAAVRGGALALHLRPGRDRVEQLPADLGWIGGRLTVFFTGIVHHSGMVNWDVVRRRLDGEPEAVAGFAAIADAARACREALLAGDEDGVAAAVRADWAARTRIAPAVRPEAVAALERVALTAGAAAVKACGAGGGGSLLAWHPAGQRAAVIAALASAAPTGRVLAESVEAYGCRTVLNA